MRGTAAALCIATCALSMLPTAVAADHEVYLGADLSYANEMEDCGGQFREHGAPRDVFELMREHGAGLVRVRLFYDATWTRYSNLEDVSKTIRRARAAGMKTLLDFHYSDDWADAGKQVIPRAWAGLADGDAEAAALYRYTADTLATLDRAGLMPELVQVGNEINSELLGRADWGRQQHQTDWARNAKLINAAIRAVRDAGARSATRPLVMLHIAQPENAAPWLEAATRAGVTDFDLVGISYYAQWSKQSFVGLGETIRMLRRRYAAGVLVAETAYPWTLDWADDSPNLLGNDALVPGYPATPDGQRRYLIDLTQTVLDAGGSGVIYWEPDWISTRCRTRWGQGSSWENATFFDFHHRNELLPAASFFAYPYRRPAR